MDKKLDEKTRKLLHEAVDLAKAPGACSYRAGCVAAQFVALTKPELLPLLYRFNGSAWANSFLSEARAPYDLETNDCVDRLQAMWDSASGPEAEASTRARMHAMIDSH